MGLTLNVNYKKGGKSVFEFVKKGDPNLLIPELNQALLNWKNITLRSEDVKIKEERNHILARIELDENDYQVGNEFLEFLERSLSEKIEMETPLNLQNAINLGLCQIHSRGESKTTIQIQNPNRILQNLNLAIQKIWPGLLVKYNISRYPIFLIISEDPKLVAEEFTASTEEKSEILFFYNPSILSHPQAIERGVDFLFGWLNQHNLKLEILEDPSNLERNWPYDPEFDYIKWLLLEEARGVFYTFSPDRIDLDPLEFCLKFLQADPRLGQYFSNQVFKEISDKYPEISPFLNRAKKHKKSLETDQRRENFQDLESNPSLEGEVEVS